MTERTYIEAQQRVMSKLTPETSLVLRNRKNFNGQGFDEMAAVLFEGICEYGSLRQATMHCPTAYSKAWQLVKDLEEAFKLKLVERNPGPHGYSLTANGIALLEAYRALSKDVSQRAIEQCRILDEN